MKSKKEWILVLAGGIGYTALIGATYIVSLQYVLFQTATGFTDSQLGVLAGVVGMVALAGYLFGGVLSDFFKTKTLMLISHFAAPALLIVMSTLPQYKVCLALEFGLAFFSIFTYWTPMAKYVADLGAPEDEGKRYGFFYMAASVSGVVIGLVATALIKFLNPQAAMRAVYYVYIALNLLAGIVIATMYEEKVSIGSASEDDKFQLKYVLKVLKMPTIWLIGIMGFAGYTTGKMMVYISPYLQDAYGISLSTVTFINAVANYGIAIFMSPVAGFLTDKFQSASKVLLYMLVAFLASLVILIAVPAAAEYTAIIIAVALLGAAFYAIDQTNWFTPLSEVSVPNQVRGTVIGLVSVMEFSGDAFLYNVYGSMLDNQGLAGYHSIFVNIAIIAAVGVAATVVLRTIIKKKPAETEA